MGFNLDAASKRRRPSQKAGPKKGKSADLTEGEAAYRDRQKAEAKRRKLATDGDCFSCFCFKTRAELDHAVEALGLSLVSGRYVFEDDLRSALDSAGFAWPKMSYRQPQRIAADTPANPCADIVPTGDAEADIAAQFMALYDAFVAREDAESYRYAYDSPYWFAAIFRSQDERDSFLRESGFIRYGYSYLDGGAALQSVV